MSNINQANINKAVSTFLVDLALQSESPTDFAVQVGRLVAASAFFVVEGSESKPGMPDDSDEVIIKSVFQTVMDTAHAAFPNVQGSYQ